MVLSLYLYSKYSRGFLRRESWEKIVSPSFRKANKAILKNQSSRFSEAEKLL